MVFSWLRGLQEFFKDVESVVINAADTLIDEDD